MTDEIYYLSSLDSTRFELVRTCHVVRSLAFCSGKVALEVRLSPCVVGQDSDRTTDIETAILSPRHEQAVIDPVSEFPCFVFIAIPKRDEHRLQDRLDSEDLEIIGWGELYRTHEDAQRHNFG